MNLSIASFGKKLRECREAMGVSQSELAKSLNTNHSIIDKYERDEVAPSVEVVKKLGDALDTTVGYLLGETKQSNFLKDTAMVKRLDDLNSLPDKDKEYILYALDGLKKSAKLQAL